MAPPATAADYNNGRSSVRDARNTRAAPRASPAGDRERSPTCAHRRWRCDGGSGLVSFTETGSGVLISADGKVMTAAHVVQAMDEINVEFTITVLRAGKVMDLTGRVP